MNEKSQTLLDQYVSKLSPYESAQLALKTKIESLDEYKLVQQMKSEFDGWCEGVLGFQPNKQITIIDFIKFVGKAT